MLVQIKQKLFKIKKEIGQLKEKNGFVQLLMLNNSLLLLE